jgi:hypothetical protein
VKVEYHARILWYLNGVSDEIEARKHVQQAGLGRGAVMAVVVVGGPQLKGGRLLVGVLASLAGF